MISYKVIFFSFYVFFVCVQVAQYSISESLPVVVSVVWLVYLDASSKFNAGNDK